MFLNEKAVTIMGFLNYLDHYNNISKKMKITPEEHIPAVNRICICAKQVQNLCKPGVQPQTPKSTSLSLDADNS